MPTPIYTVIPCLDRVGMLINVLSNINQPPENVIIVDTGTVPPLSEHPTLSKMAEFIYLPIDSPRNIQVWWNIGIERAAELAAERDQPEYHIAVLNSDLDIDEYTLPTLSEAIDKSGVAISSPDRSGDIAPGDVNIETSRGPVPFPYRMMGYCYMIRGSSGLRLDEGFVWWYGDDDVEWRAREAGGVGLVGGLRVQNLDESTARIDNFVTNRDFGRFLVKYGSAPCY